MMWLWLVCPPLEAPHLWTGVPYIRASGRPVPEEFPMPADTRRRISLRAIGAEGVAARCFHPRICSLAQLRRMGRTGGIFLKFGAPILSLSPANDRLYLLGVAGAACSGDRFSGGEHDGEDDYSDGRFTEEEDCDGAWSQGSG
ncbi:hypothetical protein HOY80DRAFT_639679 [Tuber brumale]|nr:hypothetical protein HOY80DRAFT_639679 [Tuber brumale]